MKNIRLIAGLFFLIVMGCSEGQEPDAPVERAQTHSLEVPAHVIPSGLVLHENVRWLPTELVEDAVVFRDRIHIPSAAPVLHSLRTGDVLISERADGVWSVITGIQSTSEALILEVREAEFEEIVKWGSVVIEIDPERDLLEEVSEGMYRTRQQGVSVSCSGFQCTGSVSLTGNFEHQMHRQIGSLVVSAKEASLQLQPAIRLEMGIDSDGFFVGLLVSGHARANMVWDVDAVGPSTMQQAFDILNLSADEGTVDWVWRAGGDNVHNISPTQLVDNLSQGSPVSYRSLANPASIEVSYSGRTRTYSGFDAWDDSDPNNPSGGIVLGEFRDWMNSNFGNLGLSAILNVNNQNTVATLRVATSNNNFISFSLFGRSFTIRPHLTVMYEVGAMREGRIHAGLTGEGQIMAGFECRSSGCRTKEPVQAHGSFDASREFEIVSGSPFVEFKAGVRAGIKVDSNGSQAGYADPFQLSFLSKVVVNEPYCPFDASAFIEGKARWEGYNYTAYRKELFSVNEVNIGLQGCTTGNQTFGDCGACEPNDANCIRDACGPSRTCLYGRCTREGPAAVTLTWNHSDPPIDLDLHVRLPNGEVISRSMTENAQAELAVQSNGGGCTDCGGQCEGSWTVDCASAQPENGQCPGLCEVMSAPRTEWCTGVPHLQDCSNYNAPCPASCVQECIGNDCICVGTGYVDNCAGLSESACGSGNQCLWYSVEGDGDVCVGGTVRCSHLDESACLAQQDCSWNRDMVAPEETPYVEQVVFKSEPQGFSHAWVTVADGFASDEKIPFNLFFDLDDMVNPYLVYGQVDSQTGSASPAVRFDFEVVRTEE